MLCCAVFQEGRREGRRTDLPREGGDAAQEEDQHHGRAVDRVRPRVLPSRCQMSKRVVSCGDWNGFAGVGPRMPSPFSKHPVLDLRACAIAR